MTEVWFVIGLIAGLLVGAFVNLVAQIVFVWYKKPNLKIGNDKPHGRYHSIEIENKGKTAAENCVGNIYVEATQKDLADLSRSALSTIGAPAGAPPFITELTERGISGAVCWAHSGPIIKNPHSTTINIHDSALLDVYRYLNGLIEIPSERGWKILRVRLKPKEYRGKLRITAANAKPQIKEFQLKVENQNVSIKFIEQNSSRH
ncbi:MAG: hypothetical protein OEY73_03670 [Hadesarchaea archaeon]|nr:hypothetical protein [Hadesarchaea archaeon]